MTGRIDKVVLAVWDWRVLSVPIGKPVAFIMVNVVACALVYCVGFVLAHILRFVLLALKYGLGL